MTAGSPRPGWLRDLERVDTAIYAAVATTPTPSLDRAISRLARAADYSRISLASGALLAATRGPSGRRAAARGLASIAITAVTVNAVVKPVARRRRPDRDAVSVPLVRHVPMPRSRSLPSGHAAAAFAFATGVGSVLPRDAAALRLLAALVGYSRVHTGVHYPGDVVIGSLIGTTLGQVTSRLLEPSSAA